MRKKTRASTQSLRSFPRPPRASLTRTCPRPRRVVVLASLAMIAGALAIFASPDSAQAAPPFVDRHITLPYHDWAFDLGLGVGHNGEDGPIVARTGPGLNVEGAVGITENVELGLRTGVRFDDGARAAGGDFYGRLFDRQTFATGGDAFANPEARLRGAVYRGDVAEIALEGRVVLPFERGTRVGAMFGVPMMFHIGRMVRLDTGAFVPVVFNDPATYYALSLPLDVWIQATNKLWLGPMTGLRFNRFSDNAHSTDVELGFGLGYQLASAIDFKTMLYIPHINGDAGARNFGVGAGFQFRIE